MAALVAAHLAAPWGKLACTTAPASSQERNASWPRGGLTCHRRVAPEPEAGSRERNLGSPIALARRRVLTELQAHKWLPRSHQPSLVEACEEVLSSQQGRR